MHETLLTMRVGNDLLLPQPGVSSTGFSLRKSSLNPENNEGDHDRALSIVSHCHRLSTNPPSTAAPPSATRAPREHSQRDRLMETAGT